MKKHYTSIGIAILLISIIYSFTNLNLFSPPGLTSPEPIGNFLNGNFPDISPEGDPYVEAFPNLTFDSPLTFTPVPDSNVLVVGQRDGKIYWFDNRDDVPTKNLVADLSNEVGVVWDGGFLGLAIHPEFGNTGKNYFYLYYTTKDGQGRDYPNAFVSGFGCDREDYWGGFLILKRIEVNPNTFTRIASNDLVMMKKRMFSSTHRGGGIAFGQDGFLYIPTGDQSAYSKPQNSTTNLDGGVLRIDVNSDSSKSHPPIRKMPQGGRFADEISGVGYYIPDDNPFLSPDGSRFEEYYTVGHRNPHRMTMDRVTGTFYIGEIGEGTHEEINVISPGKNYGWPLYEGYRFSGRCTTMLDNMPHEGPLVAFPRSQANAIIGGYVYRGSAMPDFYGKYICADYGTGEEIWAVDTATGEYELITQFSPTNIISFGEDNSGELYLLSQGNNVTLYKLRQTGGLNGSFPNLLSETGAFKNLQTLEPSEGVLPYELIEPFWSDGAEKKRWMVIPNDGTHNTPAEQISFSEDGDWEFPVGSVLIKHFELPIDERNPTLTRRLETRFSVKASNGSFYYLTYKWNNQQTDATLLNSGLSENVQITKADGSNEFQVWDYPSTQDCIACHNPATGGTLGTRTRYLNSDYTYSKSGLTGNQLVTLSHLGILNAPITDATTQNFQTYKALNDFNASLDERARSYLDLNCAYCHRPGATGERAQFDLRLSNSFDQTGLLVAGTNTPLGIPGEKILVPGNAAASILYHRTDSADPTVMMPPLAKNKIDETAVALLEDWINQMDPNLVPQECTASGTILLERYNNIGGIALNDLFNAPNYPDNPSSTQQINSFEIAVNSGDNYGVKVSGFLCPPESGVYYFWVSGDDESRLDISTDQNPANISTIANVPGWTSSRQWNKFQEQKSNAVQLIKGQRYYIQAFMKESGGGDNLAVGWRRPSDGNGQTPAEIIPGNVLSPWANNVFVTDVSVNPENLVLTEGENTSLTATVSPSDASDKSVIWSSSDDSVATVDDSGNVTAIAPGVATITVTTNDGGYQANTTVEVNELIIPVSGVTLNTDSLVLTEGEIASLTATVGPSDASDKSVIWSSSDDSIATVDDSGNVTAIAPGVATITVTTNDGGYQANATVEVNELIIPVSGVTLNTDSLVLTEGENASLTATIGPSDASDKSIIWSSSDDSVATVDDSGNVTAIAPGVATITVTTNDGGYQANATVEVNELIIPVSGVTLNTDSLVLTEGESASLTATVGPSDASDKSVIWSSSDDSIATVDDSGNVTAIAPGVATITVTTNDRGYQANATVEVNELIIPVSGVTLNTDSLVLTEGENASLTATIGPSDASDKSVIWSSSDDSVATVDDSGNVTAIAPGVATITVTTNDGGYQANATVEVNELIIPVSGVTLNTDSLVLTEGENTSLTATVGPSDASDKSVIWSSSDDSVATVDDSGNVTAIAPGVATITVTTNDGGYQANATVEVNTIIISVSGVLLNPEIFSLVVGESQVLNAEVLPANADNKDIIWYTSDDSVASISDIGEVTALSEGTSVLTARTVDGGFEAYSTLTVLPGGGNGIAVTGVTLEPEIFSMSVGDLQTLTAVVLPSDADIKDIIWYTSDDSVALINGNGEVTAVAEGTSVLTARTVDGGFEAYSTLTVLPGGGNGVAVTGVTLEPEIFSLQVGESRTLDANVLPSDADNKSLIWYTSDDSVALINGNGEVTAVGEGTSVLTARTVDGGFEAYSTVTVLPSGGNGVAVTGVTLQPESFSLSVGESRTLEATVFPANADNQEIIWYTSNDTVVSINGNGEITALSAGTSVLTARTLDGGYEAYSSVNVISGGQGIAVTGVILEPELLSISIGETIGLTASVIPSNADNKDLIWYTTDPGIATISSDGLLTALNEGVVVITARTVDGGFEAYSTVTSVDAQPGTLSIVLGELAPQDQSIVNLRVAPNPINPNSTFSLSFVAFKSEPLTVELWDYSGKRIKQVLGKSNNGFNIIDVDTYNISSGSYIITVKVADDMFSKQLIIK
ncbi:Ig-like domain-containing protein [Croceivirga thetidis]|uniref:T9SS type A sorting domain-containing protein n=1 Tax=Croceivirga thetidis TaxID=2721623 RepID=A0ABX1GQH1_9FLAO|nr:Ig-like domain-containing protein [Croceivirga thetidis]NKI31908.1 T9SS type A sorting domain-containing protein [Croceivirga thetidis]